MVLRQINFNGKNYPVHQFQQYKYSFFKNGKEILIPYRVESEPDYYVSGEKFHTDSTEGFVNYVESKEAVTLDSLRLFSVDGETLIINY